MTNHEAQEPQPASARHYFSHGRLAYLQIPAVDVRASAEFYHAVFGWQMRGDGTVHLGFADATGDMIGAWVTDRPISEHPGLLPYIYVRGIDQTLQQIEASGGTVVRAPYPEGDLWVATFRDPAGNVIGVWQREPR